MKFLRIFLAIFVVTLVRGDKALQNECITEGVLRCLGLLRLDVSSEQQQCGVVRSSVECLRGVMRTCLSEEREIEIDISLEILDKFLRRHCLEGTSRECTEEKANGCKLILSRESFQSQEEKCRAMKDALKCLRDTGDDCLDVYSQHIKDLKKRFWRRCEIPEEDTEDCPALLTEEYGSLHSPGYPNPTPKNTDCWTQIRVAEDKIIFILLNFESQRENLELESNDNCTNYYVEVLDGENRDSAKLGKACNRYHFTNSSSNSLLVHFHSQNVHGMPFYVKYTTAPKRSSSPFWDLGDVTMEGNECVNQNVAYITDCVYRYTASRDAVADFDTRSEKFLNCTTYNAISVCFIERTKERCGETDEMWATRKIWELLERDASACITAGGFNFFSSIPKPSE